MNTDIIISLITVSGSILGAGLAYYFAKKHQLDMDWRKEKINHYKVLLSSLSDLAVSRFNNDEAKNRFFLASNTIILVAPQNVVNALMNFQEGVIIKSSNPNKSIDRNLLLKQLLLVIRKDIKLSGKDDEKTFNFRLISPASKEK